MDATRNYKKLSVTVSGSTQVELFKALAVVDEVFSDEKCGKCQSEDIKFIVRTVDDNDYHELHCQKCWARKSFGLHKKGGTMFPKRKEGDNYLPDNGWVKWDKEKGCNV